MNVMLDEGAFMPTRAYKTDAGMDLYAKAGTHVTIYAGESASFDTGVHIDIPAGWTGFVKSKSGLNVKHGLQSEGVIDCGYSGSIVVKLYNHGNEPFTVHGGMKISQLVILPCMLDSLTEVESFKETERGTNGFGSTGI